MAEIDNNIGNLLEIINNQPVETPTEKNEYPKSTDVADFFINEKGKLDCTLKFDWKQMAMPIEYYQNGGEGLTAREYSTIYTKVVDSLEFGYEIQDIDGKYTVISSQEWKNYQESLLTEDEKLQRQIDNINNEIFELKNTLTTQYDYKQLKYVRGEYTDEEWGQIKSEIKVITDKINELEVQRDELQNKMGSN